MASTSQRCRGCASRGSLLIRTSVGLRSRPAGARRRDSGHRGTFRATTVTKVLGEPTFLSHGSSGTVRAGARPDARAAQRVPRGLARLGHGRLRLLPRRVRPGRHRQGVRPLHHRGRVPHHRHPDRPPDRRADLRDLGGPQGPPHPADGGRPVLLGRWRSSPASRRPSPSSSSCGSSSGWAWAASGASAPRSPWRRSRRRSAASGRGCCSRATRSATCSRRSRTSRSPRPSGGAGCSSSAPSPPSSPSSSAPASASPRRGSARRRRSP